jgi:hypothetical protein
MLKRQSAAMLPFLFALPLAACSDASTSGSDTDATQIEDTAVSDTALPDPDGSSSVSDSSGADAERPPGDVSNPDTGAADAATLPDADSPADADSPDDIAEPSDVPTAPATQPRVGIWSYSPGAIQNNTCGEYATADAATPFRVLTSADGTFEIEQEGGSLNFVCEVLGSSFLCPTRLRGESPIANTDVTISYNVGIEGEVLSAESLRGDQTVNVTCAGTQCALAPAVLGVSFPCSWEVPFTAEFRVRE